MQSAESVLLLLWKLSWQIKHGLTEQAQHTISEIAEMLIWEADL